MTNPKAKNRLHASRVDRIAIVDRPAVPDAQILVYKRHNEDISDGLTSIIEKGIWSTGFNASFVIKGTQAAVDALANEVYDAIYDDGDANQGVAIKEAFDDFRDVVVNFLMKLAKKVKAEEDASNKLTKEDIIKPFARGLTLTAMDSVFQYFRYSISSLVLAHKMMAEPEATINDVISQFEKFITESAMEIVANKKEGDEPAFEKAGRTISMARLGKIKEAISVLNDMVEETHIRYSEKSKKKEEENTMELKELIKQFESLSGKIDSIVSALKGKGMLLNEEELGIYTEKSKSEEKLRIETEGVETKKLDLIARAKVLGLEENASESDIIGAEKKAEIDVKKTEEDVIEADKKKADIAEARIVKIEAGLENFDKITAVISKKFGLKTSKDEEVESEKDKSDVFGEAITGKA